MTNNAPSLTRGRKFRGRNEKRIKALPVLRKQYGNNLKKRRSWGRDIIFSCLRERGLRYDCTYGTDYKRKSNRGMEQKETQVVYLTFNTYREMGGKLKEPEFTRAEMNAAMLIDKLTRNRLQKLEAGDPIWIKVKFLTLELIERGYMGNLNGGDVTSESNDGRSRSYESRDGRAEELIRTYLSSLIGGSMTTAPVVRT